jgi:hypothetical protein
MKSAWGILIALAIVVIVGCEGNISTAPPTEVAAEGPAPPAPAPAGGEDTEAGDAAGESSEATDAAPAEAATPAEAPAAAEGELTKAEAGVGVKGKNYGGPGFVTTPIEQYFRTGERIAFEIQIPNAMKLYKAEHDNKGPKTHEEFMNIIIKENGVELPVLAEGEEFLYVPETEELMVKHQAK